MRVDESGGGSPHWRRYRRVLALVGAIAGVTVVLALTVLHVGGVTLHPHFVIAVALGIGVSLLLAGALMGLVFVSARSGHDDAVERPTNEQGRPERRPWQ